MLFTQLLFQKREINLKKLIVEKCGPMMSNPEEFLGCLETNEVQYLKKYKAADVSELNSVRARLLALST